MCETLQTYYGVLYHKGLHPIPEVKWRILSKGGVGLNLVWSYEVVSNPKVSSYVAQIRTYVCGNSA